ncbi:MAG: CDP-diacylglycerol--serine O-phosphatidyltransferase [Deltaproteobacteria bacterium]|nr:CDP-diacylglycerol--serine O-phosphatidyltransferase [Deltaproteobacteria bacterium]
MTIKREKKRIRGVQLLPNLLTTGSLFGGFYSIVATLEGSFEKAAIAIIVSIFFDGIDGKVARITRTESSFGIEYDSLSDLVAFGVAPAILVYSWALIPFGRLGWLAGFIYTACVALRLARYNVQFSSVESKNFRGLPCPAAAGFTASTVLLYFHLGVAENFSKQIALLLMVYLLGVLMVSSIPYYGFKELDLLRRKPFGVLFLMVSILALVVAFPPVTLFIMGFVYVFSGPILYLLKRRRVAVEKTESSDSKV